MVDKKGEMTEDEFLKLWYTGRSISYNEFGPETKKLIGSLAFKRWKRNESRVTGNAVAGTGIAASGAAMTKGFYDMATNPILQHLNEGHFNPTWIVTASMGLATLFGAAMVTNEGKKFVLAEKEVAKKLDEITKAIEKDPHVREQLRVQKSHGRTVIHVITPINEPDKTRVEFRTPKEMRNIFLNLAMLSKRGRARKLPSAREERPKREPRKPRPR
ncbi:MAG: hypothetical protein V1672_05290 [Candidatus Diapherotrites archaeon]